MCLSNWDAPLTEYAIYIYIDICFDFSSFFSILADTQFKNAGHFCESIDSSHLLKAIWDLGRLNTFQRPFLGANVLNRCSRILAVWALEILDINTSNAKGVLLMGMFWSQKQAIAILLDVWKTSNSCDSCDPKCVYNFERKSEGKRAMVSALGVPTVPWKHWHHPTIQPSFGLPSFDGSCLLAICRPLPRAVEVRNTVWAAVSAPHGGGFPTIQVRRAACCS